MQTEAQETISPEQQLRNVANSMLRSTKIKRLWNGKGRSSTYVGSTSTLAGTGQQLAEMILAYLNGELKEIVNDGFPF